MTTAQDMMTQADDVARHLKLIANPNRLMIMCQLIDGEMSVGDIETALGIKQPTLSRELGRLRDSNIITARRQSKVVFYAVSDKRMVSMVKAICGSVLTDHLTPRVTGTTANKPVPNSRPKVSAAPCKPHKPGGYSQFASVTPNS